MSQTSDKASVLKGLAEEDIAEFLAFKAAQAASKLASSSTPKESPQKEIHSEAPLEIISQETPKSTPLEIPSTQGTPKDLPIDISDSPIKTTPTPKPRPAMSHSGESNFDTRVTMIPMLFTPKDAEYEVMMESANNFPILSPGELQSASRKRKIGELDEEELESDEEVAAIEFQKAKGVCKKKPPLKRSSRISSQVSTSSINPPILPGILSRLILSPLITPLTVWDLLKDKFDISAALELLRFQGWETLESHPEDADISMVKAFYSNMHPIEAPDQHTPSSMIVLKWNKRQFFISVVDFAEAIRLETQKGDFNFLIKKNWPRGASEIKRDLFGAYCNEKELLIDYLPFHLRVVHYIIVRKIMPRDSRQEVVTIADVVLLHKCLKKEPIDTPQIMYTHMYTCAAYTKGELPFSHIIKRLLEKYSLYEADGSLIFDEVLSETHLNKLLEREPKVSARAIVERKSAGKSSAKATTSRGSSSETALAIARVELAIRETAAEQREASMAIGEQLKALVKVCDNFFTEENRLIAEQQKRDKAALEAKDE